MPDYLLARPRRTSIALPPKACALRQLLRPGELHGRPRLLHHRPHSDPHLALRRARPRRSLVARPIKPGTVNMGMWSHMDWWPTLAKLAGLEPPPHDWKDNDGNPIIFDGIDLSESLLGTGPGKRDNFIYFNDQSFGGVRVKNFKAFYTAKDTWLGQEQSLKIPALYDLWWDPGENYDIVFNGAA